MADATLVKMGVCNLTFGGVDMGYTKGFVKLGYKIESVEKTVDQMDTPIDELITKQIMNVIVPMAEQNFEVFATLMPGATLTVDGTTPTKKKLELSGAAGTTLGALGGILILTPVGGDANDVVTLHKGLPIVNWDLSYDKENARVYNVEFKAAPDDTNQWVTLGDATATA